MDAAILISEVDMTGLTEARAKFWRLALWTAIAVILLLPLAAMQVTNEVTWTGFDFAMAAVLLIGLGIACESVARSPLTGTLRIIAAAAIVAAAALLWAHGAVGVL